MLRLARYIQAVYRVRTVLSCHKARNGREERGIRNRTAECRYYELSLSLRIITIVRGCKDIVQ